MKRLDLIRTIEKNGAIFVRHGSDHDWYRNPETGIADSVPRHREIKNPLARKIISRLSREFNGR
jgi:predicted RNA binding protein YcfA (HicA-like mRNA interferase family)